MDPLSCTRGGLGNKGELEYSLKKFGDASRSHALRSLRIMFRESALYSLAGMLSGLRPRRQGCARRSWRAPARSSANMTTQGEPNRAVSGAGTSPRQDFPDRGLITRLERALALAAQIVLRHGAHYAVYLDRLELELQAARKNDPTERAKRILANYTEEGGRKAMRSSRSRLCSKDGPTPYRGRDHL